ncbi:MAG: glycosyltransferase family 4 protein [Gammaproteobacteria bacterium]
MHRHRPNRTLKDHGIRISRDGEGHLQQLAHTFGNVRLYNFLDKVTLHRLYAGCRVFCLPSVFEGTGLAAFEAASYGA